MVLAHDTVIVKTFPWAVWLQIWRTCPCRSTTVQAERPIRTRSLLCSTRPRLRGPVSPISTRPLCTTHLTITPSRAEGAPGAITARVTVSSPHPLKLSLAEKAVDEFPLIDYCVFFNDLKKKNTSILLSRACSINCSC